MLNGSEVEYVWGDLQITGRREQKKFQAWYSGCLAGTENSCVDEWIHVEQQVRGENCRLDR